MTHEIQSLWKGTVRAAWEIDPAIAIFLTERFNHLTVSQEVERLVRSNTRDIIGLPEALRFLVGEKLDHAVQRDLRVWTLSSPAFVKLIRTKYLMVWAPIPPVLAISFFERRYQNDAQLLQYAHRVLEQHPVELTFFFVPQVVQALRYDDLGVSVLSFVNTSI